MRVLRDAYDELRAPTFAGVPDPDAADAEHVDGAEAAALHVEYIDLSDFLTTV